MKAFAELYRQLDETTRTNEKVQAMVHFFEQSSPLDSAWAIYFLSGRKPRQGVPVRKLAEWVLELTGHPPWLFDESYDAVGDLAETIALLLPPPHQTSDQSLSFWVEDQLLPLMEMEEPRKKEIVMAAWNAMDSRQRFIWNKLLTGGFRVGVSQQLVTRALAQFARLDPAVIAHRLMGTWEPSASFFQGLVGSDIQDTAISQPYPFFLAHPLEDLPRNLGPIQDWQAEWKWDGIRAQLIHRNGKSFLWSRGEELVTERYPELAGLEGIPNGTVLDGELLAFKNDEVLPFAQLQRRIGRKKIGKKLLEEVPVLLMAYDLLEFNGIDYRSRPLRDRRSLLNSTVTQVGSPSILRISPVVEAPSWEELGNRREESRSRKVEGLMLKRLDSTYRVGRIRGDWWKWKIQPLSMDAVLLYAQRGHGKRASLYTDYTFGVWSNETLVPVAKAYSGLTDLEIRQVDGFIRKNTLEKFGPVRTVKPELVFEIGFEGIQLSPRHKSGIAVRFPRILRWRTDKTIADADTLDQVRKFLS